MKKIVKIVFAAALSFLSLSTITSCGKKDSGDVTGSCKLAKTPTASKTFDGNGVEECTVTRYTDGDTSAIKTTYSKKHTLFVIYQSILQNQLLDMINGEKLHHFTISQFYQKLQVL